MSDYYVLRTSRLPGEFEISITVGRAANLCILHTVHWTVMKVNQLIRRIEVRLNPQRLPCTATSPQGVLL